MNIIATKQHAISWVSAKRVDALDLLPVPARDGGVGFCEPAPGTPVNVAGAEPAPLAVVGRLFVLAEVDVGWGSPVVYART